MAQRSPIVGSIVERKPGPATSGPKSSTLSTSSKTGFPAVQHRSKSTFARTREEGRKPSASSSRLREIPPVVSTSRPTASNVAMKEGSPSNLGDWRDQISKENEDKVADMGEDEREEERRQIVERFGASIGDVLKRARLAREKQKTTGAQDDGVPITTEERRPIERARSPPPSALVTPASTRPSSRADRRLRFAELDPDDVHVYESAPTSPKRRVLALPPPDPDVDSDVVSLGQWKGKMVPQEVDSHVKPDVVESPAQSMPTATTNSRPEEGTSEYIRQRYFPDAPKDDPNLAWMQMDSSDAPSSSLRFDLQGNPIPPSVSLTLPTHLGLHHHAEGAHAGYTLDDIFLLSRSTVPAQRATMLDILARISRRIAGVTRGEVARMEEVVGKEEDLRKRILAAGVEAMSERGSVGAHAIEVVWTCIVGWNADLIDVEGVELESPSDAAINTLPLDFIVPQIAAILGQGAALPESQSQLLSVLYRLAQQNNAFASSVASTPKLLSAVLQTFILTPIPPSDSSSLPDPLALKFLHCLVLSSRTNALEVEKLADSLLRFITFLPSSSPYPLPLTTTLLTWTLNIYRALASYGLYSHIAGTTVAQLAQLEQYVISEECASRPLKVAWASLVEMWIICAVDPHQTTPDHDILWSQVVGWGWDAGILELQSYLGIDEKDWETWGVSWRAQAAWLEGSKVNAIRGGDAERSSFLDSVKPVFEGGKAAEFLDAVLGRFEKHLAQYDSDTTKTLQTMSRYASVLSSVIRLWLSCIPLHLDGPPASPPFTLPLSRLSQLSSNLLTHSLWSTLASPDPTYEYRHCREISHFLVCYLRLSRRLPGVPEGLWMAQAFSILLRLGPGDEDAALGILEDTMRVLTPQWAAVRGIQVPGPIWEKGGLAILEPFIVHKIRPVPEVRIAPLAATPKSINFATTGRLPSPNSVTQLGLPLHRDWTMTPMDHLLRSADSAVFKALPSSWDSSEVEVTRAALFLTNVVQQALMNFSITSLALTQAEATFRCMQIFMLEHGQTQNDSTNEVFRDGAVGKLMEDILGVYGPDSESRVSKPHDYQTLEKAATRFLGPSVPFFQFYTDFVALYDAISFSHPLFGALLLPPTSMRYPLDYRKHLWCDFNHIVKTIRTPPERMISEDLREFLYPVEADSQILSSYLNSLLRDDLHEFPRLLALHHVASNIWPDLYPAGSQVNDERASTMFKAVVQKGSNDVVREVVQYRQTLKSTERGVLLPPVCFEGLTEEEVYLRIECVGRWGGPGMVRSIEGLLKFFVS